MRRQKNRADYGSGAAYVRAQRGRPFNRLPFARAGGLAFGQFFLVGGRARFYGDNKVERAFLQNYILADKSGHPKGMIPRCYPADYYEEDGFIPNWSLWYILEIYKYFTQYGYDETVEKSRANVEGILNYFVDFENEFGVLEDP